MTWRTTGVHIKCARIAHVHKMRSKMHTRNACTYTKIPRLLPALARPTKHTTINKKRPNTQPTNHDGGRPSPSIRSPNALTAPQQPPAMSPPPRLIVGVLVWWHSPHRTSAIKMTDLDGRRDVGDNENLGWPHSRLHPGCKSPGQHNNQPRHRHRREEFVALIFWGNNAKINQTTHNNKRSSGAEPSRAKPSRPTKINNN